MKNLNKRVIVPTVLVLMMSGIALPGNSSKRSTSSSPMIQASSLTDAAYLLLADRVAANRASFYVYEDADSGFNHGFPSGFFASPGNLSTIHIDTGCIEDPNSASGCSADANSLDFTRGNIMRISFDPQLPGKFAGINIEEPENNGANPRGVGYDLRGATEVLFDVRTLTPGGINMEFGVGGQGHTTGFIPITQNWTTKHIGLSSLGLTAADLASVHIVFTVVTNDVNAPNGATVLLDNIRFAPLPTSQQSEISFPLANQTFGVVPRTNFATGRVPIPPDQVLRNLTTTYESALTLIALLHRRTSEDLDDARLIAEAFVYALSHESHGDPVPVAPDGSVTTHNGYESGDLPLFNDQGPGQGQKGDVRLAGFTTSPGICGSSGYCLVLDGTTGGNDAFAILALAAAYKQLNDLRYLDAARTIGRWITGNLTDTTGTGYGGYYLGYSDEGVPPPKPLITGKSIENNADIFAAFTVLAGVERGLGNTSQADDWTSRANIAGDFVMQLFDSTNGRFNAGTVPVGTAPGPGITPNPATTRGNDVINTFDFLDSNSFTTMALAASTRYRNQIDWRRPVQYILNHFAQTITVGPQTFQGFNIVQTPTAGPNGIAWEFTGQAAAVMRFVDNLYHESSFGANVNFYLGQIRQAQISTPFGDGRGLVASTLQNGDTLPPIEQCLSTPFQCIAERVGLAATTWAVFADQSINPLSSIGIETAGLYNPTTSTFFLKNSNSAGPADLVFGYGPAGAGWIPLVGDWNGDGIDTVGLYDSATSTFFLKNSNSAGPADLVFVYGPGGAGWIPLVGDWNGDGTDTVGLYNPTTSTFFLKNANSAGAADLVFSYGPAGAGWTPLAGDWDGDGIDTVGLFNPSTSTFFLKNTNSAGPADLVFGYGPAGAGWTPVVGDWNGDGVDTIGLYDPATGNFFLKNTNAAGLGDLLFGYGPGGAGWRPIVGDWDGL